MCAKNNPLLRAFLASADAESCCYFASELASFVIYAKRPQAEDWGMVRHSRASRLRWFAAAEHALAAGERNPCGLFVAVYRRGLWHHITQAQEDVARAKLRLLDFGEESRLIGTAVRSSDFWQELAA